MKTSKGLLFAAVMVVALFAVPTDAQKVRATAPQTTHKSLPVRLNVPVSIELDSRDGKTVGVTAVMKDGTRKVLKQQSKPTCATGCPAGQTLVCWEDEAQLMSMCECRGGGGGSDSLSWNFAGIEGGVQ